MSEIDRFAAEFEAAFSKEAQRVLDTEKERVTRPYRRIVFWLAVGYFVLVALSILQWATS